MIGIIFFVLLWLLAGLIAFIFIVKYDGITEVDKDMKSFFGHCLLGGCLTLVIVILYALIVGFRDKFLGKKYLVDAFLEWLLNIINGEKKNE